MGAVALAFCRHPALGAETRLSPLAVEVTNASEPESCAEKDNVTVDLRVAADLRRFRIEAAHPAYIGGVTGEGAASPTGRIATSRMATSAAADRTPRDLLRIALFLGDGL